MPKPKCPECDGLGLVVTNTGNYWCQCPAGREYANEIAKARAEIAAKPAKARPTKPAIH